MSRGEAEAPGESGPARRLRAGLRRHGVVPRPIALRRILGARDVRFTPGNAVELYLDGRSGLDAMLAAIEGARDRIHLETYILHTDATGRRFLDALAERARAGVDVRLLFDAVGGRGVDPAPLAALRRAGGDTVVFNPLGRLWPRWAPRRRDHRKILVVDGVVAFTGGLNIGDEYFLGTPTRDGLRAPWRDAHVRVTGPAARDLEAVFLESWFRADGPDRPWLEIEERAPLPRGEESLAVLADGPAYRRRRMREVLVAALERSRWRVRLVTPYFLPGARVRAALSEAAGRGVRVELLLAGATDHPVLRWAAHARLAQLLEAGLHVHEYERAFMHAKVAVFDDAWAILGTSNLDRQSLDYSYEVNLVAHGGTLPGRLARVLERDFADARRIRRRDLERRPWPVRLRDALAAFLLTRL